MAADPGDRGLGVDEEALRMRHTLLVTRKGDLLIGRAVRTLEGREHEPRLSGTRHGVVARSPDLFVLPCRPPHV